MRYLNSNRKVSKVQSHATDERRCFSRSSSLQVTRVNDYLRRLFHSSFSFVRIIIVSHVIIIVVVVVVGQPLPATCCNANNNWDACLNDKRVSMVLLFKVINSSCYFLTIIQVELTTHLSRDRLCLSTVATKYIHFTSRKQASADNISTMNDGGGGDDDDDDDRSVGDDARDENAASDDYIPMSKQQHNYKTKQQEQ